MLLFFLFSVGLVDFLATGSKPRSGRSVKAATSESKTGLRADLGWFLERGAMNQFRAIFAKVK
jgi:hypothetical protein